MAHETGQSLNAVMGWEGPPTHLQYLTWRQWFEEDMNRPSRTDFHIMRVAQRVMQGWVEDPSGVDLDEQRVHLVYKTEDDVTETDSEEDVKRESMIAVGAWAARLGGGDVVQITKEEAERIESTMTLEEAAHERRRRAMAAKQGSN